MSEDWRTSAELAQRLSRMAEQAEQWRSRFLDPRAPIHPSRHVVMAWLIDTGHRLGMRPTIMAAAASIFDSYLLRGNLMRPAGEAFPTAPEVHGALCAAVGIARKMDSNDEYLLPLNKLLEHLIQSRLPLSRLWDIELGMLQALDFEVNPVTPRELLEVLVVGPRLQAADWSGFACDALPPSGISYVHRHVEEPSPKFALLASYLCDVALLDAQCLYAFSAATVASACLLVALCALGAPRSAVARRFPLGALRPADGGPDPSRRCASHLCRLWAHAKTTQPFGCYGKYVGVEAQDSLAPEDVEAWIDGLDAAAVEAD